jgi:cellulase
MKFSVLASLALATMVQGHAILQEISVNGARQGSLKGLRSPNNNNPVTSVSSSDIVCGQSGYKDSTVINVPAGARVGGWYQHVLGGPQGSNDPDNPIAASHKGPVTAWLAKVNNAASDSQSGLKWFKIGEDSFNTGSRKWGVDNLISNGGWVYFNIPQCVANGQYLLRIETLALHNAYSQGGAQFYTSCAQIQVTNGGNFSPSQTVSFPGGYSSNDGAIVTNIYGSSGQPDNNGQTYNAPGPRPISC